jgi:AcrR family transcriptional regulator
LSDVLQRSVGCSLFYQSEVAPLSAVTRRARLQTTGDWGSTCGYCADMERVAAGRPGRPAAATREAALAHAGKHFLAGERIDVQAIARELGLARATMHRWFLTREALLGEVLATLAEQRLCAIRAETPGRGAAALLETFDRFNRELAATDGLRVLLAHEQERALRILTSSAGIVQPRMVAAIEQIIDEEVRTGDYSPTVTPSVLAYAIIRLGEAFLYNDAIVGIRGDTERLRELEGALLRA